MTFYYLNDYQPNICFITSLCLSGRRMSFPSFAPISVTASWKSTRTIRTPTRRPSHCLKTSPRWSLRTWVRDEAKSDGVFHVHLPEILNMIHEEPVRNMSRLHPSIRRINANFYVGFDKTLSESFLACLNMSIGN